nr:reverse transcriptase domain-containing protein [Tanacetum cinerariifolium]
MSAAAIQKLVADKVAEALEADRATRNNPNVFGGSGGNGVQGGAPPVRECTLAGFMKNFKTRLKELLRAIKENRRETTIKVTAAAATTTTITTTTTTGITPVTTSITIEDKEIPGTGHMARDCKGKTVATVANAQPILTFYEFREKGQTRNRCLKRNNPVLFDSGSDKSFVNTNFSHLINIKPVRQNASYEVELADGGIVSTNTVLKGCILKLVDHLFKIKLMPIELGTFNIVIEMDWLFERDAVIVCSKKKLHISVKNKVLVVKGNEGVSRLKVISCIKARKYVEKGSQLSLAYVIEKEPKGEAFGRCIHDSRFLKGVS